MPRTTDLPKTEIVARYAAGDTVEYLATLFNREASTMRANLIRWGATMRRRGPARRYTLDEAFFDRIDTEAKAYWLGFIYADGGVRPTGAGNWSLRVELARSDCGHLEKLRQALGTDAPIADTEHRDREGKVTHASLLCVCSVRLCNALQALGCVANKTYGCSTPKIRTDLQRHFYRGLFDGDGSLFYMPKIHGWRYEVVGPPAIIAEHQRWLVRRIRVRPTKLIHRKVVDAVRYTGGIQIEQIMHLLYEHATVYLDRKFERYLELLARPT